MKCFCYDRDENEQHLKNVNKLPFRLKHVQFRLNKKQIIFQFIIVLYCIWHLESIAKDVLKLFEHQLSSALLQNKKQYDFLQKYFIF